MRHVQRKKWRLCEEGAVQIFFGRRLSDPPRLLARALYRCREILRLDRESRGGVFNLGVLRYFLSHAAAFSKCLLNYTRLWKVTSTTNGTTARYIVGAYGSLSNFRVGVGRPRMGVSGTVEIASEQFSAAIVVVVVPFQFLHVTHVLSPPNCGISSYRYTDRQYFEVYVRYILK